MKTALFGIAWALAFVILESAQFVFFGGLFQRMSSFLFGFLVFGIIAVGFIGWAAITAPSQVKAALANPRPLIAANVAVVFAVGAYLLSVQLIEPAITYTISGGVMPMTAYLAYRFGVAEGEPMRNTTESLGNILLFAGVVYLAVVTIGGWSGFVRGDAGTAILGVLLAVVDGVMFTWVLIFCQRLDRVGVGPGAVFGLRFPLYVMFAGGFAVLGFDHKGAVPLSDMAVMVALGLVLTVPPLYALQRAIASVSTLTIGTLTALGPFVIFALQMIEGRVAYSTATLAGLGVFFVGAMLASAGAVNATVSEQRQ
ncbi:MAG: hypothetical protein AAF563_14815 [Pseudomonadota bacterium]